MLALRPGGQPVRRLLAIGAHSDDLEIGCAGTILALTRAHPDVSVHWVVLAAPGAARRRGTRERRRVASARRASADRGPRVPRRVSAAHRRRGEGHVRGPEGARRSPAGPHAHARRPPSGSSSRVRADLEHVQGPPDPRVRDPEVGRRLGRPNVYVPLARKHVERKLDAPRRAFREPAREALVRQRGVSGADAPPRHGVPRAEWLRRGVPRAKADARDGTRWSA